MEFDIIAIKMDEAGTDLEKMISINIKANA